LIIAGGTEGGIEHGAMVVETGDRAFKTEHKILGLPVITHLAAAKHAAAPLAESLAGNEVAEPRPVGRVPPLLVRRGPADMTADIKAAPVEDGSLHCRRLGVGPRREIGSGGGASPKRGSERKSSNEF